jgi:hypothetical protein
MERHTSISTSRNLGVTVMYLVLYLFTMLAALSVIDLRYLQSQLGRSATLADYARIVWLTCSMGIMPVPSDPASTPRRLCAEPPSVAANGNDKLDTARKPTPKTTGLAPTDQEIAPHIDGRPSPCD